MLVAVTPGAVAPPLPLLELLAPLLLLLVALLLLLPDDPQAASSSVTAAMTPTYANDLVPRKHIPLLLNTVDPTGIARTSTRVI
jgi:hypothetical protein